MARSLADFVREALETVEAISAEGAAQILEKPGRAGWNFIDVRESDEFVAGHIPGARNFPRGFLEVRADLEHYKRDPWLEDRGRKMILYCGGGHRSALAGKSLQEMGFQRILSLAGGWTGWVERNLPIER
jgi:rhodanese-related sulfurtransferase